MRFLLATFVVLAFNSISSAVTYTFDHYNVGNKHEVRAKTTSKVENPAPATGWNEQTANIFDTESHPDDCPAIADGGTSVANTNPSPSIAITTNYVTADADDSTSAPWVKMDIDRSHDVDSNGAEDAVSNISSVSVGESNDKYDITITGGDIGIVTVKGDSYMFVDLVGSDAFTLDSGNAEYCRSETLADGTVTSYISSKLSWANGAVVTGAGDGTTLSDTVTWNNEDSWTQLMAFDSDYPYSEQFKINCSLKQVSSTMGAYQLERKSCSYVYDLQARLTTITQ